MTSNSDAVRAPISRALPVEVISAVDFGSATSTKFLSVWKWLTRYSRGVLTRGAPRRLRIAETVSLGEKRFASILQVDGEQFLIGGSPSSIVLLAKLEEKRETDGGGLFESVLLRADSSAIERQAWRNGSIQESQ